MKIIAVSGVARVGKDTIADGLVSVLLDMNPSFKILRTSFANQLKSEAADFIQDKFNIDVFSAEGKDKEVIRPILVGVGQARRAQTQGRHWINLVEKEIQFERPDITIISDLRFAEETADELQWLQEKNGKLIHISRFKLNNGKKEFVKPPNADEKRNDPLLKKAADFLISWPDSKDEAELKQMTKDYCERFYLEHIKFFS